MIKVENLSKEFKTNKKYPGFKGAIKSFFSREYVVKKAVENISFEIEEGESVANALKSALLARLDKDIVLGYTGVGPHRDDIKIKINGEDVRTYGSQGQQRTSALSLKLAELEIFKNKWYI